MNIPINFLNQMDDYLKSPLNYTGGKYKLLNQITPMFPSNIETFVDLFAGGCNVAVNVKAENIIANDISPHIIELYNYFKVNTIENIENDINNIVKKYNLSNSSLHGYEYYDTNLKDGLANYNRENYMRLRADYNKNPSPIKFYTLLIYAFNNQIRFNKKGEFNLPVNKRDFTSNMRKNLKLFVRRIKNININFIARDFNEINIPSNSFVYVDPPYLATTASYNENGGWNDKCEVKLLKYLDELDSKGIKFALSNVLESKGIKNDILIEWSESEKYHIHYLNYSYSNCSYQTKNRDKNSTTEVLITNYNPSINGLTSSKSVEKLIHESSEDLKNIPYDTFSISNRRYMGSKTKLLSFIEKSIKDVVGNYSSFVDIFSGTGVVGHYFNKENAKIISNDLLYSNYVSNYAFLSNESYDYNKMDKLIVEFNNLKGRENYFSKHFGDKFFSNTVAKKIGTIRENIEKLYKQSQINFREKAILITSLIYASDKIANTCGHYDAYRGNLDFNNKLILKHLDIFHQRNSGNEIYNQDSNTLFSQLDYEVDIVYADPPYNSRQYSSLYHLVENLARWEKPEVEGKASKMKNRKEFNSKYCNKTAIESFDDLISNVKAKYFILSYSDMGTKGNDRSNARMSDVDIIRIMKQKGKLIIKDMAHKAFSAGKSKIDNHRERLFICELNNA